MKTHIMYCCITLCIAIYSDKDGMTSPHYQTGTKTRPRHREGGCITGGRGERSKGHNSGENPPIMAELSPERGPMLAESVGGGGTECPQSVLQGEACAITTTSMRRGMESRQRDLKTRSMAEWESDHQQHVINNPQPNVNTHT